jgi:site-specific DNA-methyltransferase (adenine-specific)
MGKELLGSLELNRIYQRDCLEGMKLIPDSSIDMILCDLPYGVTSRNKWDVVISFEHLWKHYERIIKHNGAIILTATQPFATDVINSNRKLFRYDLIWNKKLSTGFLNAKKMPLRQHEHILIFYKKLPTYNPQMETRGKPRVKGITTETGKRTMNYGSFKGTSNINNEYYPTSILEVSNANRNDKLHPTQKPLELFEYLILTYTNENEVVLDNCMGSGTAAVAAIKTNRKFIGFETEPKYIEIANQRIESTYNEIDDENILSKLK